ncbi:fused MFS/spermidine synthase [Salinibaculum salinum]|uniref:spermidine synthase n=1 Tax=Salinibaculum salinum TaxID=3131996 RepID=UPI0030EE088D
MSSVPERLAGRTPNRIESAVFVSGVASMGLEIVAGRQIAPVYGSSVFTWGSIIGVFLAALAVGYWLAGRSARTSASRNALALVFVATAAYVALIVVAGDPILRATENVGLPARFAPVLPITILFGPPTVLLGFVSPYGAELIASEGPGDASGQVYALGTGGSILGAFATTFVLIPEVKEGVVGIEFGFGVLLLLTAVLVAPRGQSGTRAAIGLVGALLVLSFVFVTFAPLASGDVVYETQTAYQQLEVVDDDGVRTLYLDGVPHSAMDKNHPDRYVFSYTRYFHLSMLATDDVDNVLFIGGGGFSGPKRFQSEYNVSIDVVEIDPEVASTAKQYFRVEESENFRIHTRDGREYLEETNRTYDVVVLDAYRADKAPIHLTTEEFMTLVSDRMDDDGVVVANVISARTGPESAFYRAQYRTMDQVFPQVYSFPTSQSGGLQNIELVATNSERNLSQADFERRNQQRDIGIDLSREISFYRGHVDVGDAPLLTDGYAPVDSLLARQVDTEYVIERTNDTRAAG